MMPSTSNKGLAPDTYDLNDSNLTFFSETKNKVEMIT